MSLHVLSVPVRFTNESSSLVVHEVVLLIGRQHFFSDRTTFLTAENHAVKAAQDDTIKSRWLDASISLSWSVALCTSLSGVVSDDGRLFLSSVQSRWSRRDMYCPRVSHSTLYGLPVLFSAVPRAERYIQASAGQAPAIFANTGGWTKAYCIGQSFGVLLVSGLRPDEMP